MVSFQLSAQQTIHIQYKQLDGESAMRKLLVLILTGLLMAGLAGCKNQTDKADSTKCDRQCLEGFVDQYLEAMIANDTLKAPFSDTARYTENAEEIPLSALLCLHIPLYLQKMKLY